jgi:hypothetical protein
MILKKLWDKTLMDNPVVVAPLIICHSEQRLQQDWHRRMYPSSPTNIFVGRMHGASSPTADDVEPIQTNLSDVERRGSSLSKLPSELIFHIIDTLAGEPSYSNASQRRATLATCSLVSRNWRAYARKKLFRHVFLRKSDDAARLLQVLTGDSGIWAAEVKTLRVGDFREQYTNEPRFWEGKDCEWLAKLVPLLVNLEQLWVTCATALDLSAVLVSAHGKSL